MPDFIFWGSKITAVGDFSHEIKRCLLLGKKIMTNLDSIFIWPKEFHGLHSPWGRKELDTTERFSLTQEK